MQLMSSELQLLPDYGHRLHGPKLLQGFRFATSVIISSSPISILYDHDTFVCLVYHMYHMSYHHIIFVSDISVTFLHHDIFVTSALGPSSSHNVASPPQFVLSVLRVWFMIQIKITCVIQKLTWPPKSLFSAFKRAISASDGSAFELLRRLDSIC